MSPDREIDDYVRQLVDQAPPLSAEQRARLRVLLHPDTPQPRARQGRAA